MQDFACRKTLAAAGAVAGRIRTAYGPIDSLLARHLQLVRVMKLTLLFITVGLLQANANGYSQQLTMDVKEESLIRVFAIIKKQTGYVYFGATELLAKAKPVTFKVRNEPLDNVLRLCFRDQPLDYVIDGKTISVFEKKKEPGTTTFSGSPAPLLIDLRGRVTNEENDPVAGVSVQIKGTRIGTSTNGDGEFTLNKVPSDAVLVLTAVNIQSIEARVDGRRMLDLKVKGKTGKLDEVQVIAYGKTSQRFNVGNVTTVKAEDIEKQPVQNPLLALQGRVPGLEVTQLSGMNGTGVMVRIQGRNSINSGLEPLVVIDGVPYPTLFSWTSLETIVMEGSPLNYINPSDIESIDILKDADATAIYGSRAANGAILITTKKGKAGRTKFNINLQQGWGKVTRKVDLMNTRQYLDMRYEAYKNDGIDPYTLRPNGTNYDLTLWDTTRYTDWQKELIGGTAQYTHINAGVSGGTATMNYLISGTYNRQTTVFRDDRDDKNGSLHFNLNGTSLNQKIRIQLSGSYMYDQNRLPSNDLTGFIFLAPNAPNLYNKDGTLNWAPNAAGRSTWTNPLASRENSEFNNTTKTLVSNVNISYRIIPWLEIRTSFGYTNSLSDQYAPSQLERARPENRPFTQRISRFGNRDMSSWIIEPQLLFTGNISKGKIEGLLGATLQHNSAKAFSLFASGYTSNLVMKSLQGAQSITVLTSNSSMSKYNALFGRLNYNWNDKYLLNLTARRDGSSRFGDANKMHNFWSTGAGWIFSQEKWVQQSLTFLSFGKLRASYGTTGNDQIGNYSYLSLYDVFNPGIPYQNITDFRVNSIPNPHLQWEETRKWQWGLDLGFISDRIIINATYARNRSSNQLIPYTMPSITGFTSILQNFPATIQNTSWEFMINTINIKGKKLTWTSNFNLTIPRNKVESFPNIEKTPYANGFQGVIIGQPFGITKVYRYEGVDPATGLYRVIDKHGNPTSSPDGFDKTALVSTLARYYGGMQNTISYKGFQLDVVFQFVRKKGLRDSYYFGLDAEIPPGVYAGGHSNQPVTVLNRWQKPGDNATIARYVTGLGNDYVIPYPFYSDFGYSYEASYIRLKNLSFSWQLPSNWLKKTALQNARLYFNGQNLVTITKYAGIDPESNTGVLPPLKMWTVGVQLEF